MFIEDKIWFTFDCMPSEQGTLNEDDCITYFGLAVYKWNESFYKWKQYKQCSKKERKETSSEICEAIKSEKLVILPLVAHCKVAIARKNGEQLSKEIFSIKEFKDNLKYKFFVDQYSVNKNRAFMYANYLIALSMLSWRAGQFTKLYDFKKFGFAMDLLPGDHRHDGHHPGLETMKTFVDSNNFLNSLWADSKKSHKLDELGFGYSNQDDTLGDVLADWFAQSFHASINPESFKKNIKSNTEERRKQVSDIVTTWKETLIATGMTGYLKPVTIPYINDFSGVYTR